MNKASSCMPERVKERWLNRETLGFSGREKRSARDKWLGGKQKSMTNLLRFEHFHCRERNRYTKRWLDERRNSVNAIVATPRNEADRQPKSVLEATMRQGGKMRSGLGMETFVDIKMRLKWNHEEFSILKWGHPGHWVVQNWAPTGAGLGPQLVHGSYGIGPFKGAQNFTWDGRPHYL